MCEDDEERFPGAGFADRALSEARDVARDVVRDDGIDAAEYMLNVIAAGLGHLIREVVSPSFADVTEFEAFQELMLDTDGPYYLGVSLADTITVDGVESFEAPRDRVAFLEAAAAHLAEALERERAAAAEGGSLGWRPCVDASGTGPVRAISHGGGMRCCRSSSSWPRPRHTAVCGGGWRDEVSGRVGALVLGAGDRSRARDDRRLPHRRVGGRCGAGVVRAGVSAARGRTTV